MSLKISQFLREKGFKLPQNGETWCNYHSKVVIELLTLTIHFMELKKAITCVTEEDEWYPKTTSIAFGLLQKLSNYKFVNLLCFFKKLFLYSVLVFLILQTKCTADIQCYVNEIKTFYN
jgi:hypothetical protein